MRAVWAFVALALGTIALPCAAQETPAPEASTADVERCANEHETARLLRLKEQWLDAREAMTRCADESCPIAIRADCAEWLRELAQLIPTLIVVVERDDDGSEPVRLELDGRTLEVSEQLGPIEVLPGKHLLRFTLGSYAPIEREVVIEKGAKNRVIRVRFARERRPLPAQPVPAPKAPARIRPTRPIPTSTYLLSGGAVAAFATSGSLLVSTLSSLSAARDTCAPNCKTEEREDIEMRLLAVDGLAAAGVILSGFAIYTFVRRPVVYETETLLAPALELGSDRLHLSIEGRF